MVMRLTASQITPVRFRSSAPALLVFNGLARHPSKLAVWVQIPYSAPLTV